MREHFVFLPVLIPLLTGVVLLPLRRRLVLQRVVAALSLFSVLYVVAALTVRLRGEGIIVYELGGWPAPFGIVMAVDLLSALLMLMGVVTAAASLFFAFRSIGPRKERYFFYSLIMFLVASVNGALMTGDIFNLYVFFELILISSYLLFTHGGRAGQLKESFKFLLINSVSSAFLLLAIAGLYADGHAEHGGSGGERALLPDKRIVAAVASVFVFAFGVKAALVPLFFWLPRTYAEVSTAAAALSAGVGTKVGVYALYRMFTLIFVHHVDYTHKAVLMVLAVLTMVIGVLGAIAQMDFKRLLSFHIVSQIGYMIFGLAVMSVAGLAGGLMHIMFNMIIKPALFLIAGATEEPPAPPTWQMSGVIHYAPRSYVPAGRPGPGGVPPMSGFISKVTLFQALAGGHWWATGPRWWSASSLFSMIKIFRLVYWGPKDADGRAAARAGVAPFRRPGAALWLRLLMAWAACLVDYDAAAGG